MKKEMKSIVKTSIFSVERILFNQKLRNNNVTISCQSLSQMIKKRVQHQED
jgi:hypothetical protein